MIKNYFSLFVLIAILIVSACQTQSEDSRFGNFLLRHEKLYAQHFPEGKYIIRDSLDIYNVTDNDLFQDIQFCNGQMEKLGSFELMDLEPENQEKWKETFGNLKERLEEIEVVSNLRSVEEE
jgi:hypothetical protein